MLTGGDRGIRFSKVISYGNAADLNEGDFLEYLAQDADTSIIAAYVEGVRDGRRFFKALAGAAKMKLVVVVKGGRTSSGSRAASSHTGALSAGVDNWDALCEQAGAAQVHTLGEVLDLIETGLYMRPPGGRRACIVGWGGLEGVIDTDACEMAGLAVPALSSKLRLGLSQLTSESEGKVGNPLDSRAIANPELLSETMKTLATSHEVDFLLICLPHTTGSHAEWEKWGESRDAILATGKSFDFPIAVVQSHSD
ncbi:MAG: hypothetical protein NTU41_03125, partial [Chloroflexi bacterium]|nr:hypothetical protein [Chloroflexota bacterium]